MIPGDPRNTVGATFGYFRWTDIGPRDNVVNDNLTDINFGLSGSFSDEISWETYATFSEYRSTSMGRFYLSYAVWNTTLATTFRISTRSWQT